MSALLPEQASSPLLSCAASHDGADAWWKSSTIDIERSSILEKFLGPRSIAAATFTGHSRASSQPVLLPAGGSQPYKQSAMGAYPQQMCSTAFCSDSSASAASHLGMPVHTSMPGQPEWLSSDDPVSGAIAEANTIVADRGRLRSVADQQREALGLHCQARDIYYAAAQRAFDKGKSVTMCTMSERSVLTACQCVNTRNPL